MHCNNFLLLIIFLFESLDGHDFMNTTLMKPNNFFKFEKNFWTSQTDSVNETVHERRSSELFFDISSCSMNLLQPYTWSRPIVQSLG